eukprot:NODE_2960_length_850_cov_314.744654.p1 GENE.NODE_2960_length_850_cov_314.744654~~NODE_2960_length_850_cov_314.744654.p1  ORF type:complete len:157 (+),score=48.15 NODE_2960_length_850_cov_314.744654:3-473(+)
MGDGSGTLTYDEFQEQTESMEMQEFFCALQLDAATMNELFSLLDYDGTGEVGIEDFVTGVWRVTGPPRSLDLCNLLVTSKRLEVSVEEMKDYLFSTKCSEGLQAVAGSRTGPARQFYPMVEPSTHQRLAAGDIPGVEVMGMEPRQAPHTAAARAVI